jgi:hypothetical protein
MWLLMARHATLLAITLLCGLFFLSQVSAYSGYATASNPQFVPHTASTSADIVRVGLINNFTTSELSESLAVDPSILIEDMSNTQFLQNLTAGTLDIDVLVLANVSFTSDMISGIQAYLNNNGKVFLILGSDNASEVNLLDQFNLLSTPFAEVVTQTATWDAVDKSNPVVSDVEWNSIPEARVYFKAEWKLSAIDVLLDSEELGDPLLLEATAYTNHFLIMTPLIDSIDNKNYELSLYYNYINYRILKYLAGQAAESYVDWPYSPVPHASDQISIWIWLVVITAVGVGGFLLARRISQRHLGAGILKNILKMGAIKEDKIPPGEDSSKTGGLK